MDWTKAKLGSYDAERGVRVVYVPCAEDEDPREAAADKPKRPKRSSSAKKASR